MSGIAVRINQTGPGRGRRRLKNNGLDATRYRYGAQAEGLVAGAELSMLHDVAGAARLKPSTGLAALPRTVTVGAAQASIYTNATAASVPSRQLRGVANMLGAFTFCAVVKATATDGTILAVDGYRINRPSDGKVRLSGATTENGTTTGYTSVAGSDDWMVIVAICDGPNSVISVGELKSTGPGSGGTALGGRNASTSGAFALGSTTIPANATNMVLDFTICEGRLTDADRSAYINAMTEAFPEVLA